jgi:hypothetical protein
MMDDELNLYTIYDYKQYLLGGIKENLYIVDIDPITGLNLVSDNFKGVKNSTTVDLNTNYITFEHKIYTRYSNS